MTIEITLSVIAIIGSVIVAAINHFSNKKIQEAAKRNQKENQESIALLNSRLEEKKAEKDARRDYLYDAKKRLYEECEPLFFLLNEMSQRATHRIKGFARTARESNLMGETSWLSKEGYYLVSTLFYVISPLAIFKIMQNRLTLVDLSVDPNVKTRYELIKQVYLSFAADNKIAGIEPKIPYDPDTEPEKYRKQGIYIGHLDNAIESLIVKGPEKLVRCMSYGEFETEFRKDGSKLRKAFMDVRNLFIDFNPKTRPVLWRILVLQAHLYLALSRACETKESDKADDLKPIKIIPEIQRKEFDWRISQNEASEEEVLVKPFEVAKKYFEYHLGEYLKRVD